MFSIKNINCKGQLIDFQSPKVMGILNLTPDSFYDGSKYQTEKEVLLQVEKMIADGVDFIDIGACSSKPNAIPVSETEELNRLIPTLQKITKTFPNCLLSIDTFRAKVALESIENGASIINDISGGIAEEKIFEVVARNNVPYIMMHMKGTSQNMQQLATYDDLIKEVMAFFSKQILAAKKYGVTDIIIDPGFGFAKNQSQNFKLLNELKTLNILNKPILVGVSRKSMIYKTLEITPETALNGTTVLNTIALMNGASILRVHDVKEAKESIKLYHQLIKS
jgi:dihydropteroate synthase